MACDLAQVDLDRARLDGVDLRSSDITRVARLRDLRGAVVDAPQVASVATRLAGQAGLVVAPNRVEEPADTWR